MTSILLLAIVSGALLGTWRATKRRYVNDRQPAEEDRLASWERRRGEHLAQERLRKARLNAAFDARASVNPKFTPRMP